MLNNKKAQTALEYMLLLAAVVAIVLVGFRIWLPRIYSGSEGYFNDAARAMLRSGELCGNGNVDVGESYDNCCLDTENPETGTIGCL